MKSSNYTNVTGGQVVEAVGVNGNGVFYSGLQQNANLVHGVGRQIPYCTQRVLVS